MLMRLQHTRPDGELDTYHLKPGRRYHLGRGSSCEIRILDLKLSRKHCVIEFSAGAWRIEDLCSTNGCLVNGQQIVGNAPLAVGARIEAGTTALAVAALDADDATSALPAGDLLAAKASPAPVKPPAPAARDLRRTSGEIPTLQQESMPEDDTDEVRPGTTSGGSDWDPEPASASHEKTGALLPIIRGKPIAAPVKVKVPADDPAISAIIAPHTMTQSGPALTPRHAHAPAAVRTGLEGVPTAETRPPPKIKPVTIRVGRIDGAEQHSPMAEPTSGASPISVPAAPTPPATAPAPVEERTFFITVLGRRVGPLTRGAARDLKARELKGTLSQSEIEAYPRA